MESQIQLKIGKTVNKIAANRKHYLRRKRKVAEGHHSLERSEKREAQLLRRLEFYINLQNMQNDAEREVAIANRQSRALQQITQSKHQHIYGTERHESNKCTQTIQLVVEPVPTIKIVNNEYTRSPP